MASHAGDTAKDLTASEIAYIKAVFRHSRAKVNADWDKVAEEVKVKDGKCARERFRQISVKHAFGGGGRSQDSSPQRSPAKVTKKRTPRKKKVVVEEEEEEDEEGGDGEGSVGSKWTAVNKPKGAGVSSPFVKDEDVFGV